jgi:hypothetical protein
MPPPTPVDVLNYCIAHAPEALRLYAFGPRVKKVRFRKVVKVAEKVEGAVVGADGRPVVVVTSQDRRNLEPGRTALVLVELPEEAGAALKGPEPTRDWFILFQVDRAVFDRLQRQAASGLVLPPGAQI